MARLAIDGPAPAAPSTAETQIQDLAVLLLVVCAVTAIANPGIAAGGAFVLSWRWLYRPSAAERLLWSFLAAVPLLLLHSFVLWGWPWQALLAHGLPFLKIPTYAPQLTLRSFETEALLGPLWGEAAMFAVQLRSRRLDAQVRRDHRLDMRRWRAISGRRQPTMVPDPHTPPVDRTQEHPDGAIRLGVDAETGRALDLELPGELAAHVFLPGASGSGKTTTVTRLADGALANGYAIVIVDAKAGGLGGVARDLAQQYGVPFHIVDPDDPRSLGYNPCSGDPASVANKIVGAFSYGPSAEIYKNIAMEAVPLVVRGLQEAGEPVTLQAVHDAFDEGGMERIAKRLPPDSRTGRRLFDFAEGRQKDRVGGGGRGGLRYRLGALLEGKFGDLFREANALDWDKALTTPCVIYVALSALASSEDVELMGRVIAQDLKQVCARRLRQLADGAELVPVLSVFDEFAALNEAEQLVDLLLQARQALMPTVISTQYLPETFALRQACLGAGLLIVHRVAAEDAEAIAAQFGTRRATDVTHQIDYASGYSEKGSIRRVDRYQVNPNEFREFTAGQAAVKIVPRRRYTIATVPRRTDNGGWEWPTPRR